MCDRLLSCLGSLNDDSNFRRLRVFYFEFLIDLRMNSDRSIDLHLDSLTGCLNNCGTNSHDLKFPLMIRSRTSEN